MYNNGITKKDKELNWMDIGFDFKFLKEMNATHFFTRIRKSSYLINRSYKNELPPQKSLHKDFNFIESGSY